MTLMTALSIPCYFFSGIFFWQATSSITQVLEYGESGAYVVGLFIPAGFFFFIGFLLTVFAHKRMLLTEKEIRRQQALEPIK